MAGFIEVLYWIIALIIVLALFGIVSYVVNEIIQVHHRWRLLAIERDRLVIDNRRARRELDLTVVSEHHLPVAREDLLSGALTQRMIDALIARIDAGRLPANVPSSIHYAPSFKGERVLAASSQQPPASSLQPTDFWQLYMGGALPEHGFLLGHNLENGQPVMADWKQLYSALIGGQSGSGKSTLIRCILAQAAMQGGKFMVIDPHHGDETLGDSLTPLRSLMLADPASSEVEMKEMLRGVAQIGQARLSGQNQTRYPLVLIVDELTALLSRSSVRAELLHTLAMIAQETRKVGIYALCVGQQFSSEIFPAIVRNSFVSMVSFRARRDVARVMSGNNFFGQMAENLTTGQAVWMQPSGEVMRLAVPNTTDKHIRWLAKPFEAEGVEGLPVATRVQAEGLPPLPSVGSPSLAERGSDAEAEVLPGREASKSQHAKALMALGATEYEAIREVWNVTGGRAYLRAKEELQG